MAILMFMNHGATKRQLQQVLKEVAFLGIEVPMIMEQKEKVFRRVLFWDDLLSQLDLATIFAVLHKMAGTDYVKVLA